MPAPAWNTLLSAWLAAHKTYPEIARRRGEQGTVTLKLTIGADGTVLDAALASGSGSTVLDQAAEAMLRGARLPAPNIELTRIVRLRYRLEE
jgi:protein TonB